MKKTSFLPCLFMALIFLVTSCADNTQVDAVLLHKVERKDFENIIMATGELEAVKTYAIQTPRIEGAGELTIVYLAEEGEHLNEGDTVCVLESTEILNAYKKGLSEVENAKADYEKTIASLKLQYLLLESEVNSIDAQTAISQLKAKQLEFASPTQQKIIQLEIQRAEINKEKILNKLSFLKKINASELKKMQTKIKQAENSLSRDKFKLDKMTLTTQVPGIVQLERFWHTGQKAQVGDKVRRGWPIVKIPDLSRMQVKLQVNDTQVKRIQKHQAVNIRLDAKPELNLVGKITRKTPMGRPVNRNSKVKVFDVYASVDTSGMDLQPGLSTTCTIHIMNISDTLIAPLFSVFDQDSIKIVYLKSGKKFKKNQVSIGGYSDNEAIVTQGLKEGDVIALMQPPDILIDKTPFNISQSAQNDVQKTIQTVTTLNDTVSNTSVSVLK